ncbi:MAG: short-chain dehydrogenase [Halobacteriovoraceae bacterium]|nr:short-chain dehydrogenase [Halobacteriovoraceae bacterium]|tara:strand:+ start:2110 stop:2871 length:762 start_codon:yes stop_codon:yes gene_type:complete
MKLLDGKVAIITGASSGIGRSTAILFAKEGAKVVVAARRKNELDSLVEEIKRDGGIAHAFSGDVTSEEFNQEIVEKAISVYGQLDIAFNNAGTLGKPGPIQNLSIEDWNQTMSTNLTSCFLAAKYQVPAMLTNGGAIIFTSSFVGHTIGFPHQSSYSASKAGVIGLTKSLATEVSSQGIRINALLPGGTDTPMAKEFGDNEEAIAFVRSIHAMKRIATPEEMAKSALYLASDLSSFTTGSAMLVDGGVSINKT